MRLTVGTAAPQVATFKLVNDPSSTATEADLVAQFEFLMNMLRRAQPLGVVINTRRVRESHVDPDGRGAALPMTGRHSHAYREFRQRRAVGLVAPGNLE